MNEAELNFPSKLTGSVYNGHQRWHGDHGKFIKRDLAMRMIAQHLSAPFPDEPEQLKLDLNSDSTPIDNANEVEVKESHRDECLVAPVSSRILAGVFAGMLLQNDKHHQNNGNLGASEPGTEPVIVNNWWEDDKSFPELVGATARKDLTNSSQPSVSLPKADVKFAPPSPSEKLVNILVSPYLVDDKTDPENNLIYDTIPVKAGFVSEPLTPAKLQDYLDAAAAYRMAQQLDPRSQPKTIAVSSGGDIDDDKNALPPPDPDTLVIDPLLRPREEPYISLSQRFREWRYSRALSKADQKPNKRRKAGLVLAGLVGAAVLVGLLARDSDDNPRQASVTINSNEQSDDSLNTPPETTVIVITPTSGPPAVIPEVSAPTTHETSFPPGSDTTIPHFPPPETLPVQPQTPAVIAPVETPVTVMPTETTSTPSETPATVLAPEAPITVPADDTPPMPSPVTPSIGEAVSFSPDALPYPNALALGVDRPNAFIQAVLNEYNRRYARAFIWNHDDGMFYEGRHIMSPEELKDYNLVMTDAYNYILYNSTQG